MPKTIIVTSEGRDATEIIKKLVEKRVVQFISHRGVFIFARHYLSKNQVREAYKRTKNGKM